MQSMQAYNLQNMCHSLVTEVCVQYYAAAAARRTQCQRLLAIKCGFNWVVLQDSQEWA
jgi:hypothetical protein